ncbi:hypothetical protein RAB80_003698 [Fusarium oxysporum f. sp. vasinfectum]|uniref:Gfo/Idh/MocA-like oxidoreductase C-terminal domain-containing protein n=1 Tax=Fusarium oxysporum f. sp. vasinfectum 25433 TaxID=1089449 RepID=X0LGQ1_FUSOX|nr:hypothetical protein FOTG_11679 [Fusarium oxysporum f. sp. vasinfectum 25433]KAK2681905.1 hypothetical protein RAB80_003698 [Fusarium oxysporum f. sp. vasinfectum]KAK2933663.1 hypothetical protein FoTM2_004907 [Fusarium oxysporum f. sp. vasinfectum]
MLGGGKNVFCEKAFTTRYFPLSLYVQEIIESGRIGPLERVLAEHSLSYAGDFVDDNHIMMNPMLAGRIPVGGGIYSLTWVFEVLRSVQPELSRQPRLIKSAVAKYYYTEVDAMSTILLEFSRSKADGGTDHAVTSTSLRLSNDSIAKENDAMVPNIRIQGQYGEVQIVPPAYGPTRTRPILKHGLVADKEWPQPGPGKGSGWYTGYRPALNPEGEGHGLFWEADDAGRGIMEGRKEGSRLGLDESILIMEVMDKVRSEAGVRYPYEVETAGYPLQP